MFEENTLLPSQCEGSKFLRRRDLDPEKRLHIAFMALQGVWGAVTELAREFLISRTFVYVLRDQLEAVTEKLYGEQGRFREAERGWIREQAVGFALSLRLEGRCSIGSISQILKRFGGAKYHSVGWVSEILQFVGGQLPNTLVNEQRGVKLVIMSSDEIFSHLRPILLTVEPVSSTIMRIEVADSRQVAVWKEHWQCIEGNGYCAVYLVNDEGKSMSVAQKEVLANVIRQSDTFHGVAHRLGAWVDRLENAGYKAIEHEEDRFNRLQKAKSDEVMEKESKEYEEAKEKAEMRNRDLRPVRLPVSVPHRYAAGFRSRWKSERPAGCRNHGPRSFGSPR